MRTFERTVSFVSGPVDLDFFALVLPIVKRTLLAFRESQARGVVESGSGEVRGGDFRLSMSEGNFLFLPTRGHDGDVTTV
jgi:hypothetical protein